MISVVIASYNAAKYIEETLDSILIQDFVDWDCWVVDDGSTDNTGALVEEYCRIDSRFNLVRTVGANGPYICANMGIERCGGQYVARLDADDICLPGRLRKQFDCLESMPAFNICCTEHFNMFGDGRLLHKKLDFQGEELKYYLMFKNPLLHSSMFFRKQWFIDLGMYPRKRLAQDYYIWCTAVLCNELAIINEPLVKWRILETSLTKVENPLQTQLALDANKDYLRKLSGAEVDPEWPRLFFGTFRGIESVDSKVLISGLAWLFELEARVFKYRPLRSVRCAMVYNLTYQHASSFATIRRILFMVVRHDWLMLFHWQFFKLYVRVLARLWR